MENEFVPIRKDEDEVYTNKMELELDLKMLMTFLLQTHLEKMHVPQSQSPKMAMVLSTDNSSYLNMDDIMAKVHAQYEEIPTASS